MLILLKNLFPNAPSPALPLDLQDTIEISISAQSWNLRQLPLWLLAPLMICVIATDIIFTANTGEFTKDSWYVLGTILAIWALAMVNRAINSPSEDVILWISAACGAFFSLKILLPKLTNRLQTKSA